MQLRALFADTRPLRNAHFRRLWSANIVTVIGAQLTVVAVPAQIYSITRSSAYVGLTGVFGLVPLVVFGLWGGALADVFDRRSILRITTVGLIVTSAAFWVQAALGLENVWLLLGLFAVQQAFFAVNQPTRSAVIPRLIPVLQLPAANSLNITVMQAGAIAGPLVGGALIPVLGYSALYFVDTLTLFATLWAVVLLPAMPIDSSTRGAPGFSAVLDGLGYLRGHPVLLMSFLVDIIAMVFGMPRALFPQIAHESFLGPSGGGLAFAVLFAGIPSGAVIGGIFSGWVSRVRRPGRAVVIAIVVWGVAIAAFGAVVGIAPHLRHLMLVLAVVSLAVGGAADTASSAFRSTMLQSAATDAVRGRLQGVFIVVVAGGPRIADVLHGGLAAVIGPAATAALGGVLVVVLVLMAAALVPSFGRFRTSEP